MVDAGRTLAGSDPLLRVEDLSVSFPSRDGSGCTAVLREVSFDLVAGEALGIVGESGSGKTLTALALLGLLPAAARVEGGSIRFRGADLLAASEAELRRVRGGGIAMIFQEPAAALDPVFTIGRQIAEAVGAHREVSRKEARRRAIELLERVALPDPASRVDAYPHELSGGQQQRAMIAIALAGKPEILLADEPTTALDVTVQAQILDLLADLRRDLGLTLVLITHDLGVVARSCERGLVMYAGQVVEEASVRELFGDPAHPYTRALVAASPRLGEPAARGEMPTVPGSVPALDRRPPGCAFHPRCPDVVADCSRVDPPAVTLGEGRRVRCLLYEPDAVAPSETGGPAEGKAAQQPGETVR